MEGDVSKAQQATIEESEKVQEITLEIEKKNKDRDVRLEELMTLFERQKTIIETLTVDNGKYKVKMENLVKECNEAIVACEEDKACLVDEIRRLMEQEKDTRTYYSNHETRETELTGQINTLGEQLQVEKEKNDTLREELEAEVETKGTLERRFLQLQEAFDQSLEQRGTSDQSSRALQTSNNAYKETIEELTDCVSKLRAALNVAKNEAIAGRCSCSLLP